MNMLMAQTISAMYVEVIRMPSLWSSATDVMSKLLIADVLALETNYQMTWQTATGNVNSAEESELSLVKIVDILAMRVVEMYLKQGEYKLDRLEVVEGKRIVKESKMILVMS